MQLVFTHSHVLLFLARGKKKVRSLLGPIPGLLETELAEVFIPSAAANADTHRL